MAFNLVFPQLFLLLTSFNNSKSNITCPATPPGLKGPIEIDITFESIASVEEKFKDRLLPGGWHKSHECKPRDRVAIIVPYRNRANQLPILLKNLHSLLMKQQIEYGIFVVEQTRSREFNRGALMNVGFLEAIKLNQWDCFIFHDVDLIPMDDRNLYNCPKPNQPRHMASAIDKHKFRMHYPTYFGGINAFRTEQFEKLNGFANTFWGWGTEDDDMLRRVKAAKYKIFRNPNNIARYTMLKHSEAKKNPNRQEQLKNGWKHFKTDGLNSLKYEVYCFERKVLYTWILTEIKENPSRNVKN